MDDEDREPGYGCLFGLLLMGSVIQIVGALNVWVGGHLWATVMLLVSTVLLVLGCVVYADQQGRHPAWGLLGVLNLVGMFLLLLLPEFEARAEKTRKGFSVLPPHDPEARRSHDEDAAA